MNSLLLGISSLGTFGCNAKVRARDLFQIINDKNISALADDAGVLSVDKGLVSSIDTILPVTRNPFKFGQIAVRHALNDLYAIGAVPTDVCVSYGVDETASANGIARTIHDGIVEATSKINVGIANSHTFTSRDVSVTIAATGSRPHSQKLLDPLTEYQVVLTKPLGAALGCYLGYLHDEPSLIEASETVMLHSHHQLTDLLSSVCYNGTTDITGFGLLGHLTCLAVRHRCEIQVDCSAIPIIPELLKFEGFDAMINCSATRNSEDFGKYVNFKVRKNTSSDMLLWNGETAGPIACIVTYDECERLLSALRDEYGFASSMPVATLKKSDNTVVELR